MAADLVAMHDPAVSFAEKCYLSYLVPAVTDTDLDELFKDVEPGQPIIESFKTRETLFFGLFPLALTYSPPLTSYQMRLWAFCSFSRHLGKKKQCYALALRGWQYR